ncbi:sarcoplasmic reticulum histidine-rich calcium-binding protein-like, partial [Temnothorax curvispinosus]|uniref:Sarcoplasmic reticulum histidine-rich calcium-binding protein-like n=1 Tax=Temnothorax curvispinosus TaxID=300111 RepID=A0A6J1Q1C2_9HYME
MREDAENPDDEMIEANQPRQVENDGESDYENEGYSDEYDDYDDDRTPSDEDDDDIDDENDEEEEFQRSYYEESDRDAITNRESVGDDEMEARNQRPQEWWNIDDDDVDGDDQTYDGGDEGAERATDEEAERAGTTPASVDRSGTRETVEISDLEVATSGTRTNGNEEINDSDRVWRDILDRLLLSSDDERRVIEPQRSQQRRNRDDEQDDHEIVTVSSSDRSSIVELNAMWIDIDDSDATTVDYEDFYQGIKAHSSVQREGKICIRTTKRNGQLTP